MIIPIQLLQILWVSSYYLATTSLVIFLFMIFLRLIADRKNLERIVRTRKLRRLLLTNLDNPKADIKKLISLEPGDSEILVTILRDLSDKLSGRKKETLLRFLTEVGVYDREVKQLRSWRLPKRLVAIRTLCHWTDKNTKRYLVQFLNSKNGLIQATVIDALAKMQSIELLPRIVEIVRGLEMLSQPMLTDIFTKFGPGAAPELTRLAGDKGTPMRLRLAAILALGNLPDKGMIPPLLPLMADPEYEIRANVLRVLERQEDRRIEPVILKGLNDESWIVRLRAAYCAKKMPSKKFLKPLEACLKDTHWLVEQRAIEAIHALGGAEAKRILKQLSSQNTVGGKHAAMLLAEKRV